MKQGWEIKKLGEACKISPPKSEIKAMNLKDETLVSFLPMEDLGINQMYICPHNSRSLSEVSGGYTYFAENDILLAKVTPCFENGKLGIVKDLCSNIGFGSSEYIVIRADESNVKSEYIYYGLMSDAFKKNGARLMLGASGLKRLPKGYVANYELGIPSELSEQERIVGVLDSAFAKIEALRANAQQNLQNTKDLFQASLKQELTPKQGWTSESVKDLSKDIFAGGDAPQDNFSEYRTDKYNIPIYANAVKDDGFYGYTDFARVTEPSLTIAARGSGTGYVLERKEAYLPIVRLIVIIPKQEQIQLRYLYYSFKGLDITRSGSAIPQLTIPMIRNYTISFPLIAEQTSIVEKLDALSERCRAMEENYRQTIAHCNALKQALLTKAFNGEL